MPWLGEDPADLFEDDEDNFIMANDDDTADDSDDSDDSDDTDDTDDIDDDDFYGPLQPGSRLPSHHLVIDDEGNLVIANDDDAAGETDDDLGDDLSVRSSTFEPPAPGSRFPEQRLVILGSLIPARRIVPFFSDLDSTHRRIRARVWLYQSNFDVNTLRSLLIDPTPPSPSTATFGLHLLENNKVYMALFVIDHYCWISVPWTIPAQAETSIRMIAQGIFAYCFGLGGEHRATIAWQISEEILQTSIPADENIDDESYGIFCDRLGDLENDFFGQIIEQGKEWVAINLNGILGGFAAALDNDPSMRRLFWQSRVNINVILRIFAVLQPGVDLYHALHDEAWFDWFKELTIRLCDNIVIWAFGDRQVDEPCRTIIHQEMKYGCKELSHIAIVDLKDMPVGYNMRELISIDANVE